ncbi:MAG: circadian phase modifier CpmA [Betaproteobacteria bacterium RIFCSPLOWO2_02_67_12]|nr:MAG: circadian phase modifier CpmA [Betaproteobacteria bacterium RIFCSPLOWO2_02_67_12]OGA26420.1 MAG: circadian phase modifier CpmA [Betaproteobacteria bacterium RIFCSPLOWO2_02_FULL_68_150]OGA67023.1 MAG: circadian phase modifier CpmA [Betaproteobacteria bacterium RIFCSPLOWO2_12_FULL_67_28]
MQEHGIQLDLRREARIGFDEAIFCAGKSVAQLDAIVAHALASGTRRLFTRLDAAKRDALSPGHRDALAWDPVSMTATLGAPAVAKGAPRVAVVSGGSSDLPMSREAARALEYHGEAVLEVPDIGVAGLWRLLERIEEIRCMQVVIVAAGMEGALPSVIGGLVPGVVVALPTSVGYGVAEGGRAALQSALASCAPGIVAVNIDNGYGAACAALRALRIATPKDGA